MSGAKSATPLHDDDGNVTDYKNMKYSWNAENQLVSSEPKNPAEGDKKTEYLYDYMGRRARKQIFVYSSSAWMLNSEKLFVYDGWNLIKEITKEGVSSSDKFYVWGLDLSQSLQGAGGIGGLVCAVHAGEVRHFFYDANGNVGQVVSETGSIAAHYEYDPFGNIVNGVSQSDDNPFRFSTKYFDEETGLYYYGFRDYSAELGRWWSRDPIGEKGGVNLYGFVGNNGIGNYDMLGFLRAVFFNKHAFWNQAITQKMEWKEKYPCEKIVFESPDTIDEFEDSVRKINLSLTPDDNKVNEWVLMFHGKPDFMFLGDEANPDDQQYLSANDDEETPGGGIASPISELPDIKFACDAVIRVNSCRAGGMYFPFEAPNYGTLWKSEPRLNVAEAFRNRYNVNTYGAWFWTKYDDKDGFSTKIVPAMGKKRLANWLIWPFKAPYHKPALFMKNYDDCR